MNPSGAKAVPGQIGELGQLIQRLSGLIYCGTRSTSGIAGLVGFRAAARLMGARHATHYSRDGRTFGLAAGAEAVPG